MCGILGVVSLSDDSPEAIKGALNSLSHRGPDAFGLEVLRGSDATCVLGHTRLRVIDLSPLADQPMANEDGTIWVTFNGEIYNFPEVKARLRDAGHVFRSNSDTEVLVHLWEEVEGDPASMLRALRGMFAFALFDAGRGEVVLARDRLGIKPLYYCEIPDGVAFSSEARALVQAGFASGAPDAAAIGAYLRWGVVPGPLTVFSGVRELPPGSFLQWGRGRHRIKSWWKPEPCPDPELAKDPVGLLRAALTDSVSRHLVADRPVGVFLSGGLDSAVVATLAAKEADLRTLTVTFPEALEESKRARDLAGQLHASHQEVPASGPEMAASLSAMLSAMDQPTADGINTWIVSQAARQAGLVVALSGLGGDELFGGYPSFRLVPKARRWAGLGRFAPSPLRNLAARQIARSSPGSRAARLLAAEAGWWGAYSAVREVFSPVELHGRGLDRTYLDGAQEAESCDAESGDRVMLLELAHYLSNQLLRDTDQMSMSHSLEVRVPLLDDSVVRVALAVPWRLRQREGKALLAESSRVVRRPKQPFALPFDAWLRGPLREVVREGMLSETIPFTDMIDGGFRRRVWEAFDAGRIHWSKPWSIAVLRLWPEANGFNW